MGERSKPVDDQGTERAVKENISKERNRTGNPRVIFRDSLPHFVIMDWFGLILLNSVIKQLVAEYETYFVLGSLCYHTVYQDTLMMGEPLKPIDDPQNEVWLLWKIFMIFLDFICTKTKGDE